MTSGESLSLAEQSVLEMLSIAKQTLEVLKSSDDLDRLEELSTRYFSLLEETEKSLLMVCQDIPEAFSQPQSIHKSLLEPLCTKEEIGDILRGNH